MPHIHHHVFFAILGLILTFQASAAAHDITLTPEQKQHLQNTYHLNPNFWRQSFLRQLQNFSWNALLRQAQEGEIDIQAQDKEWFYRYLTERLIAEIQDPASPFYPQVIAEKVSSIFPEKSPAKIAVALKLNLQQISPPQTPLASFLAYLAAEFNGDLKLIFEPPLSFMPILGAVHKNWPSPQVEFCIGCDALRTLHTARYIDAILLQETFWHELFHAKFYQQENRRSTPSLLAGTVTAQNKYAAKYIYDGLYRIEEIGAYLHGIWANIQFLKEQSIHHHSLTQESFLAILQREPQLIKRTTNGIQNTLQFLQLTMQLQSLTLAKIDKALPSLANPFPQPLSGTIDKVLHVLNLSVSLAGEENQPEHIACFNFGIPLKIFSVTSSRQDLYDLRLPENLQRTKKFIQQQMDYLAQLLLKTMALDHAWQTLAAKLEHGTAQATDFKLIFDLFALMPSPFPEEHTSLLTSAASPNSSLAQ